MPIANIILGTLYSPNFNGVSWSQPGGPGTQVFPAQQINIPWTNYPVPGWFFSENSGLYVAGCQHWMDYPRLFFDHDNMLNEDIVLVCCALCSYLQYTQPRATFFDVANYTTTII
jgi:hypothetical protein